MKSKYGSGIMIYIIGNVIISEFVDIALIGILFQFVLIIGYWIFVFGKDEE